MHSGLDLELRPMPLLNPLFILLFWWGNFAFADNAAPKTPTLEYIFKEEAQLRNILSTLYDIPVVHVHFGKQLPLYLHYTVEMASSNNPVIVLSDAFDNVQSTISLDSQNTTLNLIKKRIFYVPLKGLSSDLPAFERSYRPTRLNADSQNRQHYELQCIERWIVLRAFSFKYNISQLFYGDNDNVLFGNVTTVIPHRKWLHHFANGSEDNQFNRLRGGTCEAMVSVEGHMSEHDFLGYVCGHSSYWTQGALADLAEFIIDLYKDDHYHESITLKNIKLFQRRGGDRIVDMSLLYMWWVAHHNASDVGWDTGRPRRAKWAPTAEKMAAVRAGDDAKFLNVKSKLPLPPVLYSDLRVCNGLDVHDRLAFDHMHGFELDNTGFTFNYLPEPVPANLDREISYEHYYLPYFIGSSLKMGGKPESLDPDEIAKLRQQKLYLMNIHYQAGTKEFIRADVCRRLFSQAYLLSILDRHRNDQAFLASYNSLYGNKDGGNFTFLESIIQNPVVRNGCLEFLKTMKSKWPQFDCVNHEQDVNQKPICI